MSVLGVKIEGFPNFSSYLGALRNSLTEDEIAFVSSRLAGARVIFDVGANFGAFALPFAKLAPNARLFAFEPNPRTAVALRQNLVLNSVPNVVVVEAAVADQDGEMMFSDRAPTQRLITF